MDVEKKKRAKYSMLLGLGLDNEDGHVRITSGKNFKLIGGSKETHEAMQDKAMEFNKALDKRKKTLGEINHEELSEIADEVGLKKPSQ